MMPLEASPSEGKRGPPWPRVFVRGGLFLLLFLMALGVALHFYRLIRLDNGRWVLARISIVHGDLMQMYARLSQDDQRRAKRLTLRAFIDYTGSVVRLEYDWDGDGVYDCRQDDCDRETTYTHPVYCVYSRRAGEWVAEPPKVFYCEDLSPDWLNPPRSQTAASRGWRG